MRRMGDASSSGRPPGIEMEDRPEHPGKAARRPRPKKWPGNRQPGSRRARLHGGDRLTWPGWSPARSPADGGRRVGRVGRLPGRRPCRDRRVATSSASSPGGSGGWWRRCPPGRIKLRQAQDDLARRERHFRSLIENGSDLITVLERDGTIRYESPRSCGSWVTTPGSRRARPVRHGPPRRLRA